VPSDSIFEIATKKTVERSDSAIHSLEFSENQVRTSSKNCRKKVKVAESAKNGEGIAECGGRGGIPP
jgi:hypothetical protein